MYSSTYIWAKVLAHMEQKLTDTIVTTWFDDTEVLELTDQKLVLYSPTVFRKDMIVSRCETYIKDALKELFDMDLELVVLDDTEIEAYRSSKKKPRFIEFNPQFTFDNFIVGQLLERRLGVFLAQKRGLAELSGELIQFPGLFQRADGRHLPHGRVDDLG